MTGLAAPLLLAACALRPAAPPPALPELKLAPAAFGHSLSLVQRLTLLQLPETAAAGEAAVTGASQSLEAQLEIEPAELRLAAMALNQRVLSLRWDGRSLQVQRHAMLPAAVQAERVLRDIQFVYWPLAAVAAALPPGWQVQEDAEQRVVSHGGQPQLLIRYPAAPRWQGVVELDNRREGYRLTIESRPL